jgi:hypothetical protein
MNSLKPEFKSKLMKGLIIAGLASILATGAYFGIEEGKEYMRDQIGKSAAEWFENYYHIPK